jgi:thiol-disulfide isomerase/thioredoxin
MDGDVSSTIASDTLMNGRFFFREEAASDTERLCIMIIGEGFPLARLFIWAESGAKIKIKGKGKLYPAWEVKSSVAYQKEENRYADKSRDLIAEYSRIAVERDDLNRKVRAASGDDANIYRKASDSILIIMNELITKRLFADIDIMEKTNVSPIWLNKLKELAIILKHSDNDSNHYGELRKKAEALYGNMSESDKTTPAGYQITSNLFPPPVAEVGDDMVDADLLDTNGNTKRLSDYLNAGKYLLLDFWSRACGPCLMAFPEMKEVSEIYRDSLTIIGISLDSDTGWKEAMVEHDVSWVNVRDPKGMGGLATNYRVTGIPNYVLISPEGKVVDKFADYGEGYLKMKMSENIKN